ncbi:MAG: BON domain-containing protein [Dehalococcoidia bacterium]
MSTLTDAIEERLAERAGLYLAVEEDSEVGLVLSGIVSSEELRQAALDIAREIAGPVALVDDIDVLDVVPDEIAAVPPEARGERGIARVQRAPEGVSLEPGDFASQRLVSTSEEASGPQGSLESDLVEDGDDVYVPPVDPPMDRDAVLGGLELTSMDEISVERSTDDAFGDEAILEAVQRELREDAATTGLDLTVSVEDGVVRLEGRVTSLTDAESAQEVAARVPGVVEVEDELEVADLG